MQQDAQAYKSQVTAIAEGQAARFSQLQGAYAQAPEVTRRRMYMDTVEGVLARAHKVLIDGQAGSNMIYLPIDKLLEKSKPTASPSRRRGAGRPARQGAGTGHRRSAAAGRSADELALRFRAGRSGARHRRGLRDCCDVHGERDRVRDPQPSSARSSATTTSPDCTSSCRGTRSPTSTAACCRSPIPARPSSPTTVAG